jgi:hypothetical protein
MATKDVTVTVKLDPTQTREVLEKAAAEVTRHLDAMHARAALAFTLWRDRWQENPEGFTDAWDDNAEYGDACATYFLGLLDEVTEAGEPQ